MKLADRLFLKGAFDQPTLAYLAQLGVQGVALNVAGALAGNTEGQRAVSDTLTEKLRSGPHWQADDLVELRAAVQAFGLELCALAHTPPHRFRRALLGLPGRDEEIDAWCKSLQAMGRAGIPVLVYTWHLNSGAQLVNWHTGADIAIRGGALAEGFDIALAQDAPLTELGHVSDDQLWDSLAYFLKAVIPVAEESGVRMAMHPADPQVRQLAGIARIMRSPAAFDRLLDLAPSPANAITFCQGCFSQMLDADGVYAAIDNFMARDAIAYVHFRNVTPDSRPDRFTEAFWDDGKVDMVRAMRAYAGAGYHGYLAPDHHPRVSGDTRWGHRSRGFGLGFMRGLIQSAAAGATSLPGALLQSR